MQIKTITGSTIQAALSEARAQLGDNVILLESTPAEGGRPAMIRVAMDPLPTAPVAANLRPEPVFEPVGFGYGAARKAFSPTTEPPRSRVGAASKVAPAPSVKRPIASAQRPSASASANVSDVDRQLQAMQQRLRELETVVASPRARTQTWRSMPLLRQMAQRGLYEPTLTRLFDRVQSFRSETGVRDAESVLIRNELRRMLQMPVLRPAPPALMVIGAGGSGKTSLLIKLARHEEYFARRQTAVIIVQPSLDPRDQVASIALYRQNGIPVQCVSTREEMRQALDRVERFDHVLFDTPALAIQPEAAGAFGEQVQEIVRDVVPMHVQLVLDASRVYSRATVTAWKTLSLRPASVAITRLDEANVWGRFAEWLMHLELPYGYASDGTAIPGSLSALSASRITEQLTSIAA